jgi:hypothetical protein
MSTLVELAGAEASTVSQPAEEAFLARRLDRDAALDEAKRTTSFFTILSLLLALSPFPERRG